MRSFLDRLFSKTTNPPEPPPPPVQESPEADPLHAQVQNLIALGNTPEALQLLIDSGDPRADMLKAQFEQGEILFSERKITFSEWSQIQANLNYTMLHFFRTAPEVQPEKSPNPIAIPEIPITAQQRTELIALIQVNQTEAALDRCKDLGINFLLTQKRFIEGKKRWNMGLTSDTDWASLQEQIDRALLGFIEQHPGDE